MSSEFGFVLPIVVDDWFLLEVFALVARDAFSPPSPSSSTRNVVVVWLASSVSLLILVRIIIVVVVLVRLVGAIVFRRGNAVNGKRT